MPDPVLTLRKLATGAVLSENAVPTSHGYRWETEPVSYRSAFPPSQNHPFLAHAEPGPRRNDSPASGGENAQRLRRVFETDASGESDGCCPSALGGHPKSLQALGA